MKRALVYIGIAAAGIAYIGRNRLGIVSNDLKEIQVRVSSIKVKGFNLQSINLLATVGITNPTGRDININSLGLVTLDKIEFFDKQGQFLGVGYPNITSLNVPAQDTIEVTNVPLQISVKNIGPVINTLIAAFTNTGEVTTKTTLRTPTGVIVV